MISGLNNTDDVFYCFYFFNPQRILDNGYNGLFHRKKVIFSNVPEGSNFSRLRSSC